MTRQELIDSIDTVQDNIDWYKGLGNTDETNEICQLALEKLTDLRFILVFQTRKEIQWTLSKSSKTAKGSSPQ